MESSPRGRTALLTTVGVLLALALVAIAAQGSTSVGDNTTRSAGDALLDVFFTIYLLALIAGAFAFVYLLVLRRRIDTRAGRGKRRSLLETLFTFLMLVAIGTLLARRLATWERPPPIEAEDAVGRAGSIPAHTSAEPLAPYEAGVAWAPVLITLVLVLLAVGAWWFAGRARRQARGELREDDLLAAELAAAVDESLDDLRAEPDPRRAVIAAYARLERVLAAHRLPRRPAEAPLEYLGRMLADLSVSPQAARRLTDLFERAKFSQHAVGTDMKEDAISALETVRDDLLAARALAEQQHQAALEAQRKQATT
jgi:hypothetical protein